MRAMLALTFATCVAGQQNWEAKFNEMKAERDRLQTELTKCQKQMEVTCTPTKSPTVYYPCHWIYPGSRAHLADKPMAGLRSEERTSQYSNAQGNKIGVVCCRDETTLSQGIGERPGCVGQETGATYLEASAACHVKGWSVCTLDQMKAEAGQGKGCNFDGYHVWTSTEAPGQCEPTRAPLTAAPKAVRGDPFVYNPDGSKTQLWLELRNNGKGLPTSAEDTLLECSTFSLYGRAMGTGIKNDHQQWFDQFRIVAHGKEQVRVSAKGNGNSTDFKALNMIELVVEGEKVARTGSAAASGGLVSVWKDEQDQTVENVQFSAGSATVMRMQSAVAQKFVDAREQRKYTHLDITFVELNKKDCTGGTLAEIWGVVPMTQETAKKLEPHYIEG